MDNPVQIAASLNAEPADIPGLWWVHGLPGSPELTTAQMLDVYRQCYRDHLQENSK